MDNFHQTTMDKKVLQDWMRPIIAISKAVGSVQFGFTAKGMAVTQFSADHVSVLTSTLFDDNASEGMLVKVDLKRLSDAIAACGDEVTIAMSPEQVAVASGDYTRNIRAEEPDDKEPRIPKVEGEPIDLASVCGRLQTVTLGDTVSFGWGREGWEVGSADESGEAWITRECNLDSEGMATFPAEYAVGLVRAIPKDCKVTAYLTDSAPIKIDYVSQEYEGTILIAPRIEEREP